MVKNYHSSEELADLLIHSSEHKVNQSYFKVALLGIMAGAFISLGAEASSAASYSIESTGLAKTLAGVIFPIGLMMITLVGGQLFTSSCMNVTAVFDKRIKWSNMAVNLVLVYIANYIGAFLIAYSINSCGELNYSAGALGAYTIKIAAAKLSLDFNTGIVSGILCNILVCLAVLMAATAKDIIGKIFAIFFPIFLFIISGFEHSVANMYYIPAGIMAAANPAYVQKAIEIYHVSPQQIEQFSYQNMLINNLLPVTIGNFIGGAVLISGFVYLINTTKYFNK
jgi:formate/nitrite transporter